MKKHANYDLKEWENSWTYIKTVVDIVREPILVLDKNFKIISVNECFLETFKVSVEETEGKVVYELGNGQWNIPKLKKLLEDILPKHTYFKGFEVKHDFPEIGKKIMILNGRQIHVNNKDVGSIILLAMEDVTAMMQLAEMLANHANNIKAKMKVHVGKVEEEINKLKSI